LLIENLGILIELNIKSRRWRGTEALEDREARKEEGGSPPFLHHKRWYQYRWVNGITHSTIKI